MPGLKAFQLKTFQRHYDWRLLEQTVVSLYTLGVHGKTRLRRERNVVIVNWIILLQSICNSVSYDTRFVMLRRLISMPFNTILSDTILGPMSILFAASNRRALDRGNNSCSPCVCPYFSLQICQYWIFWSPKANLGFLFRRLFYVLSWHGNALHITGPL